MAMAMAMAGQLNITLLLLLLLNVKAESSSVVYPAYPSLDSGFCSSSSPHSSPSAPSPNYSNHVRKRSSIIDITHSIRPDLPDWGSQEGVGNLIKLVASIPNGDLANQSELKIGVHTGTHVDAPSHIFQEYYEAGDHLDTLDLHVLNGLALVVDVPRDTNITAEAMQALHIPYGVERVLFRTLNTDRRLMWKKEFDTSYVAFTSDGAQWLRDNTKIKLIGVDYLSAAVFDYLIPAHVVLLQNKDIILVEGLNLDNVDVGLYDLHCLPLIIKADGSPIRCILEK